MNASILRKTFFSLFLFMFLPSFAFGQFALSHIIDGTISGNEFGKPVVMSADGNRIAIGEGSSDTSALRNVRVYEKQNGNWLQIGDILETMVDLSLQHRLSISLSADGNIIAIGQQHINQVNVYSLEGNNWTSYGTTLSSDLFDSFGLSVSLSADGSRIAIGSPRHDTDLEDVGSTQVYEKIGGNWISLGSKIEGELFNERSGTKLDLSPDGNHLLIGAPGYRIGSIGYDGAVRMYEFIQDDWQLKGDLILNPISQSDAFGNNLVTSADGNVIAVQTPIAFGGPVVSVYQYINNQWETIGGFGSEILDVFDSSGFGNGLAISDDGNRLVISDPWIRIPSSPYSGKIYVYDYDGMDWTSWDPIENEYGMEGVSGNSFASFISMSADGTKFIAGMPERDLEKGRILIFEDQNLSTNLNEATTLVVDDLILYPNPTTGKLMINADILLNEPVYLTNSLGIHIESFASWNNVDLAKYPSGLYFLSIPMEQRRVVKSVIRH